MTPAALFKSEQPFFLLIGFQEDLEDSIKKSNYLQICT
jgi:hypothetical protein